MEAEIHEVVMLAMTVSAHKVRLMAERGPKPDLVSQEEIAETVDRDIFQGILTEETEC